MVRGSWFMVRGSWLMVDGSWFSPMNYEQHKRTACGQYLTDALGSGFSVMRRAWERQQVLSSLAKRGVS